MLQARATRQQVCRVLPWHVARFVPDGQGEAMREQSGRRVNWNSLSRKKWDGVRKCPWQANIAPLFRARPPIIASTRLRRTHWGKSLQHARLPGSARRKFKSSSKEQETAHNQLKAFPLPRQFSRTVFVSASLRSPERTNLLSIA